MREISRLIDFFIVDAFRAFGGTDKEEGEVDLEQMTKIIEKDFQLEIDVKVPKN